MNRNLMNTAVLYVFRGLCSSLQFNAVFPLNLELRVVSVEKHFPFITLLRDWDVTGYFCRINTFDLYSIIIIILECFGLFYIKKNRVLNSGVQMWL